MTVQSTNRTGPRAEIIVMGVPTGYLVHFVAGMGRSRSETNPVIFWQAGQYIVRTVFPLGTVDGIWRSEDSY